MQYYLLVLRAVQIEITSLKNTEIIHSNVQTRGPDLVVPELPRNLAKR